MKYIYVIIFLGFTAINCSDEDGRLSPSGKDIDWFVVKDADDELEHLRYSIYEKTGITVCYTTKLGEQDRGEDAFGDRIIHEEFLSPEYWITKADNISYTCPRNREYIKNGLLFIQDRIIPSLPSGVYPRCILLVEDLYERKGRDRWKRDVYLGSMALVVSNAGKLHEMAGVDRQAFELDIYTYLWFKHIQVNYASDLVKFYAISENSVVWPAENLNRELYDHWVSERSNSSDRVPYKAHWNGYGFLLCNPERTTSEGYITPTKEQDVRSFIRTVLEYEDDGFAKKYEGREGETLLLGKYRLIKDIIRKVEAKK
jgi:hypothetical protein